MNRWDSPVGVFGVEDGPHGISCVTPLMGEETGTIDPEMARRLNDHVAGRPAQLRLDLQGLHPLAQVSLAKMLEIPHGEVRTQAWVAREIGRPGASRAVAAAVEENPLPLLVPSHRVVTNDGALIESSLLGPKTLMSLRALEALDVPFLEELRSMGIRFLTDGSTFHVPSCQKLKEPKSARRLGSSEEAHDHHFRSCVSCRPV